MEIAKIRVNSTTGRCLTRKQIPARLVGGTVSVEFADSIWDRLNKTVVFRCEQSQPAEFDGTTAVIPWELLQHPGKRLYFGIWGNDPGSDLQIPLIEVPIGVVEESTNPDATPGADPTLPIWAQLQKEIEDLKQAGVSEEKIAQVVEEYLKKNPPTVTETDPTVPAWAKNEEKPTYTADEVGALSKTELSGAVNDALAQAKESGEFDGKDGYTPVKGVDYFDGQPGYTPQKGVDYFDGDDYVLTDADREEIAEMAADLVEIPDSGGNVDQSTEKYLGDLRRTPIYRCLNIYLDGDTTGMTKDNAIMLNILILDEYGDVKFDGKSKTAWQGSGSLQYPNKNLSLKLRDKNDEESKVKLSVFPEYATSTYHLKCNYADYSMVRNSVGAKMAKGFDDTVFPVDAPMVVNSIPAILYLNGEFNGCYTLNTKQDDDLFGMDTKENPLTQIVYRSGLGSWVMSNFEYRSDGTETAEIQAKLNRLMDFCANADDATFVSEFENYLSLRNAINYWLFADVACASDSMINNWTIGTWDGLKWYMIWYDLDIIFGLFRNGGISYHPSKPTSDLLNLQYTVANPIWAKLYRNFFDDIKERYWELRNSGALTPTAIVNQFRTFQYKWGTELIEKDRAKWTGRLNKTDDIDMMYGWISERLAYLDEKYSGTGEETEKTLDSISATYSGGNVAVGTAVTSLTGIVVTAHYSDGTSEPVTEYTLSGTIVEGSNTVTVSYGGKTTTFAVTGVAESGDEDEPGTNGELPTTYTRLAYIEGDGTQYIDTEKIIEHSYTTDGDEFYLEFALMNTSPSTQVLWGNNPIINNANYPYVGNQFAYQDRALKDFAHCGCTNKQIVKIGNRYAYWCGYTANENSHKAGLYDIDDNAWSTVIFADELTALSAGTTSMCIMGKYESAGTVESASIAHMRLYEFRQIRDGRKIVHMVPALDADGKPCMYDLVAQKAHYNKGTGEFTYAYTTSNEVKLLNAVIGTGSQWIDTGLKMTYPSSDYELKLVFELTDMTSNRILMGESSVNNNQIAVIGGGNISYSRANFGTVTVGTKYEYVETNGVASLNGATANVSLTNISPTYSTVLFGKKNGAESVENNTIAMMKFYEFSYSEGGEEKIHLLPALDAGGSAGLYDTVSERIFHPYNDAFEYEEKTE